MSATIVTNKYINEQFLQMFVKISNYLPPNCFVFHAYFKQRWIMKTQIYVKDNQALIL